MPLIPTSLTPVSVPISEKIVQNVLEVLAGVSTAAGYQSDLLVERLDTANGNSPRDGLCVVGAAEPIPQDNAPLMHHEFLLTLGVRVYAIESEASGLTTDARLAALAADVRRALTRDLHRGGYAVNTEFPDKDELHVQPPASVIVWPKVRYRTLYNDPYRQ